VRAVTVAQKTRERLDVSGYLLAGKKRDLSVIQTLTGVDNKVGEHRGHDDGSRRESAKTGQMGIKDSLLRTLNKIQIESESITERWIKTVDI
jgi:hypothetical protein